MGKDIAIMDEQLVVTAKYDGENSRDRLSD